MLHKREAKPVRDGIFTSTLYAKVVKLCLTIRVNSTTHPSLTFTATRTFSEQYAKHNRRVRYMPAVAPAATERVILFKGNSQCKPKVPCSTTPSLERRQLHREVPTTSTKRDTALTPDMSRFPALPNVGHFRSVSYKGRQALLTKRTNLSPCLIVGIFT